MRRKRITIEAWLESALTWPEFRAREDRRRRWKTRIGVAAAVALSVLLAWCAVGMAVGP